MQLKDMKHEQVMLEESHWKEQRKTLLDTYLSIDTGEYLHYFRKLAQMDDDYDGLVGWYGRNASTFGQILSALARLSKATGEKRVADKAMELIEGWAACAKVSQVLYDVNGSYEYDKLMGGMVDLYLYMDYTPALDYMEALTLSAMARFSGDIPRDGRIREGMEGLIEWYTLPEHLYRAYEITGNSIYKTFAQEWDYPYLWDKLARGEQNVGPRHAYSHVNSLSSAAMAYRVTGEEHYLDTIEQGYDIILGEHTFATGGYGPAECLFPLEEGYLGDSIKANWDNDKRHKEYLNFGNSIVTRDDQWGSCEVSCCSWAVFKLTHYLMTMTGKAHYGNWEEKLLYNGVGGQLPITKTGKVMYYADYFINGGIKSVQDGRLMEDGASFQWQCCTGTFPQDVSEYNHMLYYTDMENKALYVAQYLPSTISCAIQGTSVVLVNESQYPKEKTLRFRIKALPESKTFPMNFRVPDWATDRSMNKLTINGVTQEVAIEPDTWLTVENQWKEGDVIDIEFGFTLRFESVDTYAPEVVALCYGPLVLVCDEMTVFKGDVNNPSQWIKPIQKDGYSYAFRTEKGHVSFYDHLTRDFYPYYEVGPMDWYYMYNKIGDAMGDATPI